MLKRIAVVTLVVTGAFAFTGITTTKAIGLGLAVAVMLPTIAQSRAQSGDRRPVLGFASFGLSVR